MGDFFQLPCRPKLDDFWAASLPEMGDFQLLRRPELCYFSIASAAGKKCWKSTSLKVQFPTLQALDYKMQIAQLLQIAPNQLPVQL